VSLTRCTISLDAMTLGRGRQGHQVGVLLQAGLPLRRAHPHRNRGSSAVVSWPVIGTRGPQFQGACLDGVEVLDGEKSTAGKLSPMSEAWVPLRCLGRPLGAPELGELPKASVGSSGLWAALALVGRDPWGASEPCALRFSGVRVDAPGF